MSRTFPGNASRFDPYKNFKFRVRWDNKIVAGVSKISALKRSTEVVTHREGGEPNNLRVAPSVTKSEPITLERGVTHDPEFEEWANKVWNTDNATISLKDFRKDIFIELLNEQGAVAKRYKVYRCWVSDYQALPELDANAHAVAIEHLILQNEGWDLDHELEIPTES